MIDRRARILAAAFVLALSMGIASPPAAAGDDPVMTPPVESLSPVLLEAKRELADIVARRDFDALLAHVRADTKLSFGGDDGADGFRLIWDENPQARRRLWRTLDAILALPGEVRGPADLPEYCTPYVFCTPTPGAIDPFEALVVTGTRVAIRDRPSPDGKVLARVSHVVLRRAGDDPDAEPDTPGWIRVRRASGLEGYVSAAWIRSPIDYRLELVVDPDAGTWTLDYFIAGD